jgi:hypothetical protein
MIERLHKEPGILPVHREVRFKIQDFNFIWTACDMGDIGPPGMYNMQASITPDASWQKRCIESGSICSYFFSVMIKVY